MLIPWGPWRPDVGGPGKPFCDVAQGVVPQAAANGVGYGPFPQLITATGAEALSGAPRGGVSVQKADGTWIYIAATAAKIEKLSSSYQWDDIETGRSVTTGYDVSFAQYGSVLLNTDSTSGLKAYDIETPAGNNAVSGAPSSASFVFTCDNVVFVGNAGGNNRRIQSSARGDYTNWLTQGADGKTFEDGGALIGGRNLENGLAFLAQERALRLIRFGAGPGLYAITKLAGERGCVHDRTLVASDGRAFWWDRDGPWNYSVADGPPVPIGSEKINRWAEENIGPANYELLQGMIDPARNLVLWRVDSTYALAYNWLIQEWSVIPVASSFLAQIATAGVTINDLSGTIDSLSSIINNREWAGSAPVLGGLDTSYKFATFTGSNMAVLMQSAIQSGEREEVIRWARPVSDAASTLAVGTTPSLATGLTWNTAASKGSHGWTQQRVRGRNVAFMETIAAGTSWTFTNGVELGGGPK